MHRFRGGMAALEAAVGASALAVLIVVARPGPAPLPALAPLLTFAVLVVAAENAAVLLPSGVRLSPACMVVMASIVAFDGRGVVLGAGVVGGCAALVLRHLRARKLRLILFNCCQYALSGAAAAGAHHAAGRGPLGALTSVFAAAAAFAAVNVGIILLALRLQGSVPVRAAWRDMAPHLPSYLAFGVLGTGIGLLYRSLGDAAVISLVALLLVARTAYSSVIGHRRASGLLDLVARCTRAADLALEEDEALALLDDIREGLNGDICELLLVDERSGGLLAVRLGADEPARTSRVRRADYPTEVEVLADRTARLIAAEALDEHFTARGIKNAAVAPLIGAEVLGGTLLVANRRAVNGGFTTADLDRLTTLATAIGSTLEKRQLFQRLRWESSHDPLTGHLNRSELVRVLGERLTQPGVRGGVLHLDINSFKDVNDTFGHEHGDAVLREMGRRIAEVASKAALVARVGDDEFVVVEFANPEVVSELATRLVDVLDAPISSSGMVLEVRSSLGLSRIPEDGIDAQVLLQRAEIAMYVAKERASRVEEYQSHYARPGAQTLAMASDLRRAIDDDELVVYYQPQIDLVTRRAAGCEALVRWSKPDGTLVQPDQFIGLAEHVGLIRPLTLLVLRKAVEECAAWHASGHELGVAVNLSVPLLLDEQLTAEVMGVLEAAGLAARFLTLEITESSIMREASRSIAVLERLAALGVRLSIDDFGTGYSSLAYLRDLPVHEVKIDRSFVTSLAAGDDAIVRLTLELARGLGLSVVAEGVEDAGALARLTSLGCDQAQGYLFAAPMDSAALTAWFAGSEKTIDLAVRSTEVGAVMDPEGHRASV